MKKFAGELGSNGVQIRTPESALERSRIEMIEANEKARIQQNQYRDAAYDIGARGIRILRALWIFLLGFLLAGFLYYFLFLLSFYIEKNESKGADTIDSSYTYPTYDELILPAVLPPTGAN